MRATNEFQNRGEAFYAVTRIRAVRVQRIRHHRQATADSMTFRRAISCPIVSPRRSFSAEMGALAKEDLNVRAALLKITEAVRKYTAEQSLVDDIERGLEERAKEFERPSYANIEPFFTSQHATRADGCRKCAPWPDWFATLPGSCFIHNLMSLRTSGVRTSYGAQGFFFGK